MTNDDAASLARRLGSLLPGSPAMALTRLLKGGWGVRAATEGYGLGIYDKQAGEDLAATLAFGAPEHGPKVFPATLENYLARGATIPGKGSPDEEPGDVEALAHVLEDCYQRNKALTFDAGGAQPFGLFEALARAALAYCHPEGTP